MVYNWPQNQMKKLLIVLGIIIAFFTATAFLTIEKTTTMADPGPTCRMVSNVSVNLDNDGTKYTVTAVNYNDYAVTVSWTANGYRNGNMVRVGGGQMYVPAYRSSTSGDAYTRTNTFTTTADDVSFDVVNVYVCD